jgi:glycerate 2-kinase
MKKIILAPDSFKGTMSSSKVCDILYNSIKKHFPEAEVVKIPVADGGEGTVDCFLTAVGGTKVNIKVKNPFFENIDSYYAVLPDGMTAVIEMALCSGLPLVENRKNPMLTTTYGVGEIISHAVKNGMKKLIIGIGGSATNDGGAGMAAALGVKFFDGNNKEFIPTGGTLGNVKKIDKTGILKELADCEIFVMCDVNNVLCGEKGASFVFGPQKGADKKMVVTLDNNLKYFSELIKKDAGIDIANLQGGGAAGGLGAGLAAFAGGQLKAGIEIVLDTVDFYKHLEGADYVFTGEGKIDIQSLFGKVIVGVGIRAKLKNVPVIALAGDISDGIDDIYTRGIKAVFSINREAIPFEKAKYRCEKDLSDTMDNILRIIR